MFEKLVSCPSCGSEKFKNYMVCHDYTVTNEPFVLTACESCNLIFTNPRPSKEHISKYYESTDYISHSNKTSSLTDVLYKLVRSYSLRKKVQLINKFSTNRSLLDYGCGTGHFLLAAKKKGWTITGIEPNNQARNAAELKLDLQILSDLQNSDNKEEYDVITLWHVLEHVHDLKETVNILKNKLSKTGKLIIAVPNPNSYDAQFYQEYWAAYDVPRHLYHFTQISMSNFLKMEGLQIDNTLPMKFDSFYVSLLSERYKNKSSNYIKSIINGYKSNSYAKKTGEYSSLIYIISKK